MSDVPSIYQEKRFHPHRQSSKHSHTSEVSVTWLQVAASLLRQLGLHSESAAQALCLGASVFTVPDSQPDQDVKEISVVGKPGPPIPKSTGQAGIPKSRSQMPTRQPFMMRLTAAGKLPIVKSEVDAAMPKAGSRIPSIVSDSASKSVAITKGSTKQIPTVRSSSAVSGVAAVKGAPQKGQYSQAGTPQTAPGFSMRHATSASLGFAGLGVAQQTSVQMPGRMGLPGVALTSQTAGSPAMTSAMTSTAKTAFLPQQQHLIQDVLQLQQLQQVGCFFVASSEGMITRFDSIS